MKKPDPTTFKAPLELVQAGPSPTGEEIASFEAKSRVRLPREFRSFLQQQDGGMPRPDCVSVGDMCLVVKKFLSLAELRSRHLPGVIEFAQSPFGDDYAISCRPLDYGRVYFVDHESADPDSMSLRAAAAWRAIPANVVLGFTRIASSFSAFLDSLHFGVSDWVEYLLERDPERFRRFIEEVGVDFKDEIGTPVVCLVAEYGTVAELQWLYDQGARAPDIVCRAVRNTRDPLNILRFLIGNGENARFAYQAGKPYPMGYAVRNNLTEVAAVLKELGVPESEAL